MNAAFETHKTYRRAAGHQGVTQKNRMRDVPDLHGGDWQVAKYPIFLSIDVTKEMLLDKETSTFCRYAVMAVFSDMKIQRAVQIYPYV